MPRKIKKIKNIGMEQGWLEVLIGTVNDILKRVDELEKTVNLLVKKIKP